MVEKQKKMSKMISAEEHYKQFGPALVYDGNGKELERVTSLNLETGEIIDIPNLRKNIILECYINLCKYLYKKFKIDILYELPSRHYFAKLPLTIKILNEKNLYCT